jgi:hypothetical protein
MTTQNELEIALANLSADQIRVLSALARGMALASASERLELLELIGGFEEAQVRQLRNVALAMNRPIEFRAEGQSNLVVGGFEAEFRARLQAHHGTHTSGMDRLAFEAALFAACQQGGFVVALAPSRTTRFWDLSIDGEQTSVKTTQAKALKRDTLEISKLSEAAWIQDVRGARERRRKTLELFAEFSNAVKRWFVLRIFETADAWEYELVEIPVWIFGAPVQALEVDAFDSDGPRIMVKDPATGQNLFMLLLDRSDAKITIKRLPKSGCTVHGNWKFTK